MAAIYDYETGQAYTEGIQGSDVCDVAIDMARRMAKDRGQPVVLDDDDGEWVVHPDGSCTRVSEPSGGE